METSEILSITLAAVIGLIIGGILMWRRFNNRMARITEQYRCNMRGLRRRAKRHCMLVDDAADNIVCWRCGNSSPDCHSETQRRHLAAGLAAIKRDYFNSLINLYRSW